MVYPDNIPRDGLVAEFLLDWTANDSSGNWNDWDVTDVTWSEAERGYVKEVASFNGSSSVLSIPKETLWTIWTWDFYVSWWYYLVDPWTDNYPMLFWSYVNTSPYKWPTIFFDPNNKEWGWDKIEFRITADNKMYSNISASSLYNWWHHIVLTRISWVLYLYINWKLDNSWDDTTDIPTADYAWICRDLNSQRRHWKTWLVRASWTKWLSQNEIKTLYLEGLRKLWPNLLLQYPELFRWCVWYWDFRGDASNLITWEVATVNGATLTTDHLGYNNSAYSFDGDDDYIGEHTTDINLLKDIWEDDFSILVLWKKTDNDWTFIRLWANNNSDEDFSSLKVNWNWKLAIYQYCDWTSKNFNWDTVLENNKDYLFTFTRIHDSEKIYINWELEKEATWYTNNWEWSRWSDFFAIWWWWKDYGSPEIQNVLNWSVYQVLIFNRALSASQIKQLYQLTSKKYIYPFAKYTPDSLPKPILHINWNRNGDTFYDISGNWNNGNQSGWVTSGRIGQSKWMGFDGSDYYISTNYIQWDWDFTFSWIAMTNDMSGNKQCFMWAKSWDSNWDYYMLIFREDKWWITFQYDINDSGGQYFNSNWGSKNWKKYIFALTREWTTYKWYIDWKLTNTTTIDWNLANNNAKLHIWAWGVDNGDNNFIDWQIQDVRIFNQALSPKQIEQLYYATYN